MKKMVSMMLAVVMLVSVFSSTVNAASEDTVQSSYYSDVYSTDIWYDAVNYLYEHNVMMGITSPTATQKGTFSPAASLSRGQIVTILWRMLNEPEPSGTLAGFSDCNSGAYYYDAVLWASSSDVGIISGYTDGTFRPSREITNQEMFALLYKFACHCLYASDAASAVNAFINSFQASSLSNKTSFATYSKAAVGWAYQNGFIADDEIKGSDSCTRGDTAEYIYKFYTHYQKKYGLTVINTNNLALATRCGNAMQTLFQHYGASNTVVKADVTRSQFVSAMNSAFSEAKALDICYLYCLSHGSRQGLALFPNGSGKNDIMTPEYLRTQIDCYHGTFVVFISGCYSGTYVSQNVIGDASGFPGDVEAGTDEISSTLVTDSASDEADDVLFDADLFATALTSDEYALADSDLKNSHRIKVLCSSEKSELTYSPDRYDTYYWCLGSGYNLSSNKFVSMASDSNADGRVSLNELYQYSYDKVLTAIGNKQHIVCSPGSDSYIIFESGY